MRYEPPKMSIFVTQFCGTRLYKVAEYDIDYTSTKVVQPDGLDPNMVYLTGPIILIYSQRVYIMGT